MLMNRLELALMNNPVRRLLQRRVEAPLLRRMGGPSRLGAVLEIGCGQGMGASLAFEVFGASRVDAFDLDPRMVRVARRRLSPYGSRVRSWIGDARDIAAPDDTYDAVFDYGILHHVGPWRRAVAEVARVLKPGGWFFAEEILARFIQAPVVRSLLEHPQRDRFDAGEFRQAMAEAGLIPVSQRELWGLAAWFTARKRPQGWP